MEIIINPVVCINGFYSDTKDEHEVIRKAAETAGARSAVSEHWMKGGNGALELADAVIAACEEEVNFKLLYPNEMTLSKRIETIAREVYGADGVSYTPEAKVKVERVENDPKMRNMATCMVKTHLSLSHDPILKGRPTGWILPISDILTYGGAGFIVPVAGGIKLMPGTSSDPAFRRIDVDVETGKVKGLF